MFSYKQMLLVALIVILNAIAALQNPMKQQFSNDILRLAKSAQIRAYLNRDVNPCDDFYEYACGNWKRLQPARLQNPKTTYLDQLHELYVRKSIDLLREDFSKDILIYKGDEAVDDLLRTFFESCRNKEALEKAGIEPILNVINFRGGWPRIRSQTWYEYEYDWLKVIAELRRKLGVDILVGLEIISDFEDKDMHRIKVGAPKLDLGSKNVYLNEDSEDVREYYKTTIADKLRKYFPDVTKDWADEVAQQVLYVEQELAKGLPDDPKLSLKQTSRLRYASELKAAYGSYIDLNRYLTLVFNETIYSQVYEIPEDYLSNLVEVIKQTPKLTIANYTMWRVLEKFDFSGESENKQSDRWCVEKIVEYFPYQLEAMFHRNYNSIELTNELNSVWADIKKIFHAELQDMKKLQWISAETREKAIQKLEAIQLQLLSHFEENKNFKDRVTGLNLRHDKYYQNLINYLQWQTEQNLATLVQKPHKSDTEIKLPKYTHSTNKIQIPVAFMQARFFWDPSYPSAIKYGTIGFFLAQQMIQAFDSIGHKHDHHGYQRTWWDAASEEGFDELAQCFVRKYDNYRFRGEKMKDPNILDVSVSDNGGLAIAYRAYRQSWENEAHTNNETLPLLNHTPDQLYFLEFAQLYCTDYHKSVQHFSEVPEPLRVNGAIINSEDFANAMHCESGSKMNPQQKKCVMY